MRKILLTIFLLIITSICFADVRVITDNATGKLLGWQSGGYTQEHLQTIINYAENGLGLEKGTYTASFVTKEQFKDLYNTWYKQPVKDKKEKDKQDAKILKDALKVKFGWDNKNFKDLKDVLAFE